MICIYSQNNTEYAKNGDAVLIPTVCNLKMTINGTWELTIEHPYDPEERYKYIVEGAVIKADVKCISELTTVHQRFRIYKYEKNLHSVTAIAFPIAMESTYDSPIDNLVISGKTGVQAMAALQAYTNKYTLSTDITTVRSTSLANTNINNAIASGEGGSFIKVWGGEILYDNLKYSVKSKIGNANADYLIHYGRNLSEISYEKDDSGLTTRIKPISKDGIRLNGTGYVDSPKIYDYPIIHTRYMTAPYDLIEDDDSSNSATAIATRTAKATVGTSTTNESEDAYDAAMEAGYQPEYIKTIKSNIVSAVQTMALASVTSTSLYNYLAQVIADNMAWLGNLEQPEWDWRGSYENGWWYGNDDSYAKSMYVHIGKKWSYFGANGYWQEPADDSETWDWYQVTGEDGKRFGNFKKYYAHDEYVYITMDGVLKKYWFNNEGWYEAENSGDSEWDWHGSGTSEDPYWFGEEAASAEDTKKFAHDVWLFIDGALYFFDHFGYYTPGSQRQDYQWDWVEEDERFWFGNAENHEYAAVYLTSQWCKINGTWYYFDANGYVVAENISRANSVSLFTREMAALKTEVDTQSNALYTVLYGLMTAFANQQYSDGADVPALTITVNMVDLSKTTEYSGYAALEEVKLGDSVEVIDDVHDISLTSRVVGMTYDCIRDYNSQIVIGTPSATVPEILGNAGGTPVAGGFDTSALEAQINANAEAIEGVADDVQELQDGKQDKLTAGSGINITGNVISATGGSGGLNYFHENQTSLYGEYTLTTPKWSCLDGYYFDYQAVDHYGINESSEHFPLAKANDVPAIVCATICNSSGHIGSYNTGATVFISKSPEGTNYTFTQDDTTYNGGYSVGDTRLGGICANMVQTYEYDGETWYVACFGSLGLSGGGSPQDGVFHTIAGSDLYNLDQTVARIFQYVNPYEIDKYYSGLHQGDNLAFFAGGTDLNGANASIKIFNDGTTEGLVTEEDLQDYAKLEDVTEIEANPSETPTDVLNSINIDGTAYEIQGGGGGSNLIVDAQIYSTEERVVGVWIDGKPLYAKSFTLSSQLTVSATSWTNTNLSLSDVEKFVNGYAISDDGTFQGSVVVDKSNDVIQLQSTRSPVSYVKYLTVFYTKTTDIAGSGGYQAYGFSPIIYSTEEREVGVWADGKPLYQKTFYGSWSISNSWIDTGEDIPNGWAVKAEAVTYVNDGNAIQVLSNISPNGDVYLYSLRSGSTYVVNYFTIWYTKTTDTAGSGEYNTLGIPNIHYDGNEKVIGTYFGETLYERTWDVNNLSIGNSSATVITSAADFSDIKQPVNAVGHANTTGEEGTFPLVIFKYNGNVYVRSMESFVCSKLTIQFTKTT